MINVKVLKNFCNYSTCALPTVLCFVNVVNRYNFFISTILAPCFNHQLGCPCSLPAFNWCLRCNLLKLLLSQVFDQNGGILKMRTSRNIKSVIIFLSLLLIATPLTARTLDEIRKSGVIYGAFTAADKDSLNYQLAIEFTKFLGVRLEIIIVSWNDNFSIDGIIPSDVKTNPKRIYTPDIFERVDFICNSITVIPWRKKLFDFAYTYNVTELLVVPKSEKKPKLYEDLKGKKIALLKDSSYETNLQKINNAIGGGITFLKTTSDFNSRVLLSEKQVDGIVIDADLAMKYIKENQNFTIAFPVSPISDLGWGVEKGNEKLRLEIENYFLTIKANGKLDKIFSDILGISYNRFIEIANSYSETFQIAPKGLRDLDEIIRSEKLIVALRDREMVYREKGEKQFNHALAEEFARYLGVKFVPVITPYFAKYWENEEGIVIKERSYTPAWFKQFDIAAEILTPMDWRLNKIDIIPFLPDANIIIARKETRLNSVDDLKSLRGVTLEKSSYVDILGEYGVTDFYYRNVDTIVSDIINKKADYGIWGNSVYSLPQFPDLEVKLILGDIEMIGWGIKKNRPLLRQKIIEFLSDKRKSGLLDKLFKKQTGMTLEMAGKFMKIYGEVFQEGELPFIYYGTKDGLPQEEVLSIFQDRDHYMWFGTYGGVVRYNGREMKLFHIDQGFSDSSIFDIKQDKKGILYFATLKGISMLKDDKIENILTDVPFKGIHIDRQDNKWFYGDNGVYFFPNENTPNKLIQKLPNLPKNITSISQDVKNENTYIATTQGLYVVSENNSRISKILNEYCYFTYIDKSGKIWISTNSGLFLGDANKKITTAAIQRINEQLNIGNHIITSIHQLTDGSYMLIENQTFYHVLSLNQKAIHYDQNNGLKNKTILSFFQDAENNIWLGLSGGVQKLSNRSLRKFFPKTLDVQIYQIFQDLMGRIWINTENGVYYFKTKLKKFILSNGFGPSDKPNICGLLPNGNIFLLDTDGVYEIGVNSLRTIRKHYFKGNLPKFERVFISKKGEVFMLTGSRGIVYYFKDFASKPRIIAGKETSMLYQLIEHQGEIIGGNNNGLVRFVDNRFVQIKKLGYPIWTLMKDKDKIWIGTEKGLGTFSDDKITLLSSGFPNYVINSIYPANNPNYIWLGTNKGILYFNKKSKIIEYVMDSKNGLSGDEISIDSLHIDDRGLLWIGTFHGISVLNIKNRREKQMPPVIHIERILVNGKASQVMDNAYNYNQNNLLFELTALSFVDEKEIEYEFFMKGLDKDEYARKGKDHKAYYPNLPPGDYEFVYRAKNRNGVWSYNQSYRFSVQEAFWQTLWFGILVVIVFSLFVSLLVKLRTVSFKRKNKELEEVVQQRTMEIREVNKKVMDSIEYAQRIQNSILPDQQQIEEKLPNSFFLWRPRDIVSGDIYFVEVIEDDLIIGIMDCTGHGVPGAFMTMIASSELKQIIKEEKCYDPAKILKRLNVKIKTFLKQDSEHSQSNDGVDIAICHVNAMENTLTYSGARIPLLYVTGEKSNLIKGDRESIGYKKSNLNFNFTNHSIELVNDITFYMFSDGYVDQFMGNKQYSLSKKKLEALLKANYKKPFSVQKEILEQIFDENSQPNEIRDDVTVIGFNLDSYNYIRRMKEFREVMRKHLTQ